MRLAAIVVVLAAAGSARAEPSHHTAFALIVTNNRGGALDRPDLQYADDDGAHYYELFQTLAPAANVRLLTELDRDTQRLFPSLHPPPPTRANVQTAAAAIARDVTAAVHAGDQVDFYFVFAGHGDVDHGRGFIELADGAFTGADLEQLLAQIPATRAHVILDSCNSFFMITPRSPGGRRITTPRDAAAGLVQRRPNVGVFVSTSAEAEVFEWSELQSGVFSHAVRSGLAGAADANGDGIISYAELRAFVDTATADVPNAAFRPKVFARGPGGDDAAPLFAATTGPRLTVPATSARRFTVRDRDELPWIDAHLEDGVHLELRLPPSLAAGSIDQLSIAEPVRVNQRVALPAPLPDVVALADLPSREVVTATRGSDEVFRRMFARPFGPHALATYEADRATAPAPVFGVSHDDVERMRLLLDQVDDEDREVRRIEAATTAATGGLFIGAGAFERDPYAAAGGVALVVLGAVRLWSSSSAVHLRDDFLAQLERHDDPALAVAKIDARLHTLAAEARHKRHLAITLSIIDMALAGTLFAIDRGDHRVWSSRDDSFDTMVSVAAVIGAAELYMTAGESPIERTARSWDDNLSLGNVPVRAVGVGGAF